jgi:hypothetical protein
MEKRNPLDPNGVRTPSSPEIRFSVYALPSSPTYSTEICYVGSLTLMSPIHVVLVERSAGQSVYAVPVYNLCFVTEFES